MRWQGGNRYGGVEDRRGMGGKFAGGGIGALALGLLGYFIFGINPLTIMEAVNQVAPQQEQGRQGTPEDQAGQFLDTILSSTTDVWRAAFQRMGRTYEPPKSLVIYENATGTGCGTGQAAMGPFYCPSDQRIYLDLGFFRELESYASKRLSSAWKMKRASRSRSENTSCIVAARRSLSRHVFAFQESNLSIFTV